MRKLLMFLIFSKYKCDLIVLKHTNEFEDHLFEAD